MPVIYGSNSKEAKSGKVGKDAAGNFSSVAPIKNATSNGTTAAIPAAPVAVPTAPDPRMIPKKKKISSPSTAPLTDTEVDALDVQGFQEGDTVPGRGKLMPDGTFQSQGQSIDMQGVTLDDIRRRVEAARRKDAQVDYEAAAIEDEQSPKDTASVVSSSDTVVQGERAAQDEVREVAAPSQSFDAAIMASEKYIATLEDEAERIEDLFREELALIDDEFDLTEEATKEKQAGETGQFTNVLARIGGYLGQGSAATGAMKKLAAEHRSELSSLTAQRAQAVRAATNAANEGLFEIAKLRAQEAKDIEETIYNRQKDFFTQTIQAQQAFREQERFSREQAETIAPDILSEYSAIDDPVKQKQFILQAAADNRINPRVLLSEVERYRSEKNKELNSTIMDLVRDFPGAGVTMNDIQSGNFDTVIEKVTNSSRYKNLELLEKAQTDKALAEAVAAAALSDPSSVAADYEYFAEQLAISGTMPPNAPKSPGAKGIINERAKQIAQESLADGAVIDKFTGFQVKPGKLSDQQKQTISGATSVLDRSQDMRRFLDEITTFPGKGTVVKGGRIVSLSSTDQERFDAIAADVLSQFMLARSGLAVTEQEALRLEKIIPKTGLWKEYNVARLDEFENSMRTTLRKTMDPWNVTIKGYELRTPEEIEEDLQQYDEDGPQANAGNRPQRNNNPLNIKASGLTRSYDGVAGEDPSEATDGGKFLVFTSPDDGFNAGKNLLRSNVYAGLTVDAALKKWSNKGYGGELIPELRNRSISSLSDVELDRLIRKMAEREGYYA